MLGHLLFFAVALACSLLGLYALYKVQRDWFGSLIVLLALLAPPFFFSGVVINRFGSRFDVGLLATPVILFGVSGLTVGICVLPASTVEGRRNGASLALVLTTVGALYLALTHEPWGGI